MSVGTRFGVMAGYVLAMVVLGLMHGYRPQLLGEAYWWVASVAPVVVWLAVEVAGWLRPRARTISRLFVAVGVIASGGMGLWLYGLLAFGNAATHMRIGVPTVLAGGYLAALLIGTRRATTKRAGQEQQTKHSELVSH